MDLATTHRLTAHLGTFMSDARKTRMETVLARRTRYITLVLEDIYQPFNASACMRSCDAFGVQDVHVIENAHPFSAKHGVSKGAHRWLTLHRYNRRENNTPDAYAALRNAGYRIVATSPDPAATPVDAIDLAAGPVALVLGAELTGLSESGFSAADETVTIPMHGFSESLNISVATAIMLFTLRRKLDAGGIDWQFGEAEKAVLRHAWYRLSVRDWESIEARFLDSAL